MKPPLVSGVLGVLSYDDTLDWYTGFVGTSDGRVTIRLSPDGNDPSELLKLAELEATRLAPTIEAAKQFAASSLLSAVNGEWSTPGEGILSCGELAQRFSLLSVTYYPDGSHEYFFCTNGLLGGHDVIVTAEDGEFQEADIAG